MRSRHDMTLLVAALGALAVLAGGCSGGDEPEAAPTPSASTPTESASADLPESFPTEEVPLVEGEIGEVLENDALGSFLVKVYPDTDFATAFSDATARLKGAGFTMGKDVISAGPSSSTADFTSDDWFVVVTGGMPDDVMLQYSIYPAGQ